MTCPDYTDAEIGCVLRLAAAGKDHAEIRDATGLSCHQVQGIVKHYKARLMGPYVDTRKGHHGKAAEAET